MRRRSLLKILGSSIMGKQGLISLRCSEKRSYYIGIPLRSALEAYQVALMMKVLERRESSDRRLLRSSIDQVFHPDQWPETACSSNPAVKNMIRTLTWTRNSIGC